MVRALTVALLASTATALVLPTSRMFSRSSAVRMVTAPDKAATKEPKLGKVEHIKIASNSLREPLVSEMANDEIFVSHDAYQILKYHGSYQQDNRELRKPKQQKAFSFMLRLKVPCGEVPAALYRLLDDLCDEYGQGNLRATTRQAWQLHGVLKGDLKTVIAKIMEFGSSTVGACGDVSRNVMTTPAPLTSNAYQYAREYSKVMAELFKPMSTAFTELWLGEDKVAGIEYWRKDIDDKGVIAAMVHDNGRGIVIPGNAEPLYGTQYLPRKFKIGVTVPGDNSIDIYINDIGLVVIMDDKDEELLGFNVMVGGGMGRTHNKETTFARAAEHLGFVPKDEIMEVCKAILAAQRDHGNREIRANARMKYLVHNLGIDAFRSLVETYHGSKIAPWREMVPWKYSDWMGWHEQGDGKLFFGLNIEQGRVKDQNGVQMKSLMRKLVDEFDLDTVLSPSQSVIFKDINPADKPKIEAMLAEHNVDQIENIDPLTRLAIACPAMPMCGLAITEAERVMPTYIERLRALLDKLDLRSEEVMFRMTGCPNGCARPYMAELAFVGDGPKSYQIWVGGSPVLEGRTGWAYKDRVNKDNWEDELEPLFQFFKEKRLSQAEAFGDFCFRVGQQALLDYSASYVKA